MKKLLVLLGTLMGAFLFAFVLASPSVHAEDEAPVEEETTIEFVDDVDDDKKTLDDILGIKLTDEQVNQIIDTIGKYTNDDVKNLSITLYAAFGIAGVLLLILVIVLVIIAIKYGKKNAFTDALIHKLAEEYDKQQKTNYAELVDKVDDSNEEMKKLVSELITIVADKKTSKIAEQTAKIDERLSIISAKKID